MAESDPANRVCTGCRFVRNIHFVHQLVVIGAFSTMKELDGLFKRFSSDGAQYGSWSDNDPVSHGSKTSARDSENTLAAIHCERGSPAHNGTIGSRNPEKESDPNACKRISDVEEEVPWWRIMAEICVPFLCAGVGMVAAGLYLNVVQVGCC